MRPNLLNLYKANARRGQFRAEANTLFVYDVIVGSDSDAEWFGGVSPEAFTRALRAMTGPVSVRINSPGGDVFAGRAMAQAMREYPGEITAHVDGVAASAASLLAVTPARCVMAPGSMLMIHQAWTIGLGNAGDFRQTADLLAKIDLTIADDYAAKSGRPAEDFSSLMAAETWFTPAEAIAMGLADEIAADPRAAAPEAGVEARWDLSAYARPPTSNRDPELSDETVSRIAAEVVTRLDARALPIAVEPEMNPNEDIERRRRHLAARLLQPAA